MPTPRHPTPEQTAADEALYAYERKVQEAREDEPYVSVREMRAGRFRIREEKQI